MSNRLGKRWRLLIVLGAALLIGAIWVSPASAARQLTVSKTTDLADGDVVTVSWSGFSPGTVTQTIYIEQCKQQVTDIFADCAALTLLPADNGADGSGSAQYTVRSQNPNGTPFDEGFTCDNPCAITARESFDNSDNSLVSAPVTFAPTQPPVIPEASLPVLLPIGALLLFGAAYLVLRRRRSSKKPAAV
jgi:Neocarzinostatin family